MQLEIELREQAFCWLRCFPQILMGVFMNQTKLTILASEALLSENKIFQQRNVKI